MASNIIDRPAIAGEDRLNMKAYSDALIEFIANAQSPLTIALQGEWGSGKTSLMNALKKSLVDDDKAPYNGVWVNTWQYALMSNPEDAIIKILLGIIGQITSASRTSEEERKSLFKKVFSVGRSVVTQVVAKQTGVDIDKTLDVLKEGNANGKSSVESLKEELEDLINKTLNEKRGYLFFIDDLDRIDPPVAVQILELLKNIFDLEKCIFVLAIDYAVVVKGLRPKFGDMTAENEREFRSFFDKIIQLPFSMPVGSYIIDDFLTDSLVGIGYLEESESGKNELKRVLTSYALESVGTNPRSLKRLINYLSLIRLIIRKTETKEDDEEFKCWKDVLFALVCLQIQYPKVYDVLIDNPDFPSWGEPFEQKAHLPKLEADEVEKLNKMEEFDETWEKMLFRFCRCDTFLESRAISISRILNKVKSRIMDTKQPVGETIKWLTSLSSVTNVKSESEKTQGAVEFNRSDFLKALRWRTLGLRNMNGKAGMENLLPDGVYISSWQRRIQTNLACELWIGDSEDARDFLTEPMFHIYHDGKSFQMKIWNEFWGNWPKEKYKGIDFESEDIQSDLISAEDAFRAAWTTFGINANIGHNQANIWWNVTIPFKDKDELTDEEFSNKLRDSLARVAKSFAMLLPYRIPTNNNK